MEAIPTDTDPIGSRIAGAARTVQAAARALPSRDRLVSEIADAERAAERGYFLPDEDERVRTAFSRYLGVRAALFGAVLDLEPLASPRAPDDADDALRAFGIALCAACMLVRSARFIVDAYAHLSPIAEKLDEAEPRFGIPAGQFTAVFRSLTRPAHVIKFAEALHAAERRAAALDRVAGDDPDYAEVRALLHEELALAEPIRLSGYARSRVLFWRHAVARHRRINLQRVMFSLMEMSGRAVAEMRNPFRAKRVTPTIRRRLRRILQPGDVLITRHDDAVSNLFLPGFWPHAALYIGSRESRAAVLSGADLRRLPIPDRAHDGRDAETLEAKKDGVLFRSLDETLAVDACCVIRPKLPPAAIAEAIARAASHAGKLYDFDFDFRRSDRLVCTEVVYRSYHGVGGIAFDLERRSGRLCLPAQRLVERAIAGDGFEPAALFGAPGRTFAAGSSAAAALAAAIQQDPEPSDINSRAEGQACRLGALPAEPEALGAEPGAP